MQKTFNQPVAFYLDPYFGRQTDQFSCSIDAIVYLKDGLRLDMLREIIELSIEQAKPYHAIGGRYPNELRYYQNPKELLKHAQSNEFPENLVYKFDLDAPLKTSKNQKSLRQHREQNRIPIEFVGTGDTPDAPPLTLTVNASLFQKAKTLKRTLDESGKM